MTVPNIFATQSGNVPASELDVNFQYILDNTIQNSTPSGTPTIAPGTTLPPVGTVAGNLASLDIANMTAVQNSMTGGFVNKFINGTMNISQSGASGSVTSGGTGFTLDGWYLSSAGGTAAWNKVTYNQVGSVSALQITGAAGITAVSVFQRIEGSVAQQLLAGTSVTVTFAIFNGTGAALIPTLDIYHATALDNWAAQSQDVASVSLQSCPDNTITICSYTFTPAASSYNGLAAYISFGNLATAAHSVGILYADIRSQPGATVGLNSFPPPMEYTPIGLELLRCQRYLEKSFPQGTAPAQNATAAGAFVAPQVVGASATMAVGTIQYKVTKRIQPTVTFYNPSAANAQARNITNSTDCSATALVVQSDAGFAFSATTAGGSAAGNTLGLHWQADARL